MMQIPTYTPGSTFSEIAAKLAATAKALHARGWLSGTSGNLSAVVQTEPLLLAMSPSGVDKGELTAEQVLLVDEGARVINGGRKPSDETLLHLEIVKQRQAGAVLHTHSIWNTILSDMFADEHGVAIEGYEMLKGLDGVRTHEHREWLPIIANSQDMRELADTIRLVLTEHPNAHGLLLHKHGLYSWGKDLREAKRHIEILEFLLEALGRTLQLRSRGN
ncbi:MAG TPA: methylthioribulose 1-phosphate dehydratase [Pyrinomonadaceae bacterium]|nr:methylthioribulose 1-phosphate dehydratase [Pyrinomonadaceae bacterium]